MSDITSTELDKHITYLEGGVIIGEKFYTHKQLAHKAIEAYVAQRINEVLETIAKGEGEESTNNMEGEEWKY